MTTRRDGRPSQVRPRPPSTGRPAPAKTKARSPAPGRIASHRRVDRTRGLALPVRLLFIAALIALTGGVLFAASGGVGKLADAVGSTLAGFVTDLTTNPSPSPSLGVVSGAPSLEKPDEPYTNQPTIDLVGTIPGDLTGNPDSVIRIYVAIGDQDPGVVTELPVGRTPRFVVPDITLVEGSNAFTATIVGPAGESDPSTPVTYVLDATIPRITLSSPKNGAVINAKSVLLVGRTQARSAMRIRNASTNAIVTGAADENGNFSIALPIGAGTNDIGITAIDPAGNENHLVLAVRKGSGTLTTTLSASVYQIKVSKLPEKITLSVVVNDPDGRPLEGARVTFSIAAPGVSAITSRTIQTGGDGVARWTTTIPKGATTGQISATVIVKTSKYGELTDRTVITIVK
jgi:hypothetical protein